MKREEIIEALEHVSEKLKVKKADLTRKYKINICPVCKTPFTEDYINSCVEEIKYCYHCGQRIEVLDDVD